MTDEERDCHYIGGLLLMKLADLTNDEDLYVGIKRLFRGENYASVQAMLADAERITVALGAEAKKLVTVGADLPPPGPPGDRW